MEPVVRSIGASVAATRDAALLSDPVLLLRETLFHCNNGYTEMEGMRGSRESLIRRQGAPRPYTYTDVQMFGVCVCGCAVQRRNVVFSLPGWEIGSVHEAGCAVSPLPMG